ncbi:VanZ family protein [Viridibacillus sp. YIM B01967]|uniref:VanZ family protein n=1 Tax=Viridibacillus soli TaxID=2798301 RepID=A0ABS1H3D6_9BACL|nr:VanZ family protein [Viridibacillus soli]MBK3493922.1 VanZ family protein [Viridibacillus soli]
MNNLSKEMKLYNVIIFLFSLIVGTLLYINFLYYKLPRFFSNLDGMQKNALALLIVIFTFHVLIKIAFRIDVKFDRYLILGMYLFVLFVGLVRIDLEFHVNSTIELNPFGFISDIAVNSMSIQVLVANICIFLPMYFLLTHANIIKGFLDKFLFFEAFAILMEVLQYVLKVGIFDVSDILLYNISYFLGCFLYISFQKVFRSNKKNIEMQ